MLLTLASPLLVPPAAGAGDVRDRPVEIEVVVTERGAPLAGLPAAAFGVRVDGAPVPIETLREATAADPLPVRYLVFVDDVFCPPAERNAALWRIERGLDGLGPEHSMALAAFDGTRLEVLAAWSRSRPRLRAALAAARARPSEGSARRVERRQLEAALRRRDGQRELASSFSGIGFAGSTQLGGLGADGLRRARAFSERIAGVLEAAAAALEAVPPAGGRRVLLLLTGGWQLGLGPWILEPVDGPGPYGAVIASERLLDPLIAAADRHGYAVVPVPMPAWDRPGRAGRLAARPERIAGGLLMALAEETGGRVIADPVTDPLAAIAAEGAVYRLRLRPRWRRDDRRRDLDLRLAAGPGVRVRVRRGLADPSPERRRADLARAAALLGPEHEIIPVTE